MEIICVLYDEMKNKVLTENNENKQNLVSINCDKDNDYFSILQAHLLELFDVKVLKSELSIIFKSQDYIILLLNADCCELVNFEWIDLKDLKMITGVNKRAQSQILNYFLRVGKLKMESLYFSIRCERRALFDECVNLIQRNNPGIAMMDKYQTSSGNNSLYRIIFIRNYEPELSDLVEEIKLVTNADKENVIPDNNVIDIGKKQVKDIYKEVMKLVSELYQNKVMENTVFTSSCFYGVTGMTESGKSYFANHLDLTYNMWNLKIRSFIEEAKYLVDESILALLEVISIQLMLEFSCYHYFKHSLVIESIYSERIHYLISKLLKDKYKLIYIDVEEEERKRRSLDSLNQFQNKDIKKKKMGIDKLRNIADIKLDNSESISYSKNQLDNYYRSYNKPYLKTKSISEFQVPTELRLEMQLFFDFVLNNYKDNLLLFSYVGSTTNNTYIDGWSDVDVLIIFKNQYLIEQNVIFEFVKKFDNKFELNIIDENDIEHDLVDNKNIINLYNICRGYIQPNYINDFKIKKIDLDKLFSSQSVKKNDFIFNVKRSLWSNSIDIRKTFKECLIILMIALSDKNKMCITYGEVVEELMKNDYELGTCLKELIDKIPNINSKEVRELCEKVLEKVYHI